MAARPLLPWAAPTPAERQPALHDLAAKPFSFDQFRGPVVLRNFWATWCAPCRQERPEFNAVSRQLDPQRAVIVGIAADDRAAVLSFVKLLAVHYPPATGDPDQVFARRTQARLRPSQALVSKIVSTGLTPSLPLAPVQRVQLRS
jgi:thiol-disulfide isomerase/thioredoxin